MSEPRNTYKIGDDRYYAFGEHETFLSVTSLLSRLPNNWLQKWFANMAAESAVSHAVECFDAIDKVVQEEYGLDDFECDRGRFVDPAAAKKRFSSSAATKRDNAASAGTHIHSVVHKYMEHDIEPDLLDRDYVEGACDALDFMGLEPLYYEAELYNAEIGYAGTADLIARHEVTGDYWIVDWKTGKKLYDKYAIQVGGLVNCTHRLDESRQAVLAPQMSKGAVVRLDMDGSYAIRYVSDKVIEVAPMIFAALKIIADHCENSMNYYWA